MRNQKIPADKITKPIQLLAAWLIGLILLVSTLLTAARVISYPEWASGTLVISAILIIPIFLFLIFQLQTKYRPEMQEDLYYSKYLNKNTLTYEYIESDNVNRDVNTEEIIELTEKTKYEIDGVKKIIESEVSSQDEEKKKEIETLIDNSDKTLDDLKKIIRVSSIDLKINVNLPKYSEIQNVIQTLGFSKYEEFGNNRIKPKYFLAAFGNQVPIGLVKELILKLIPFGLTHIKVASKVRRTVRKNAIFLGSYAFSDRNILIDEELLNKLNSTNDLSFEDIFSKV